MEYAHLPALGLQFTNDRNDAAKTTAVTVFNRAYAIGVIEMYKGEPC